MGERLPTAVLGATGVVGQRLVALLERHPWLELAAVAASERSVGRRYADAARWLLPGAPPAAAARLEVLPPDPARIDAPLVLSALDAAAAGPAERAFAEAGRLVVSNASAHRLAPDVPLVVPEVNPDHLGLLARQRWEGRLVTNPNCSTIGLVLALKPLHDAFGVRAVRVTSLQALSGAGHPGASALDLVDNIVPHIPGEEEKLETEPRKILGTLGAHGVAPAPLAISAQCNRVPVLDGHLLSVSVELHEDPAPEDVVAAWRAFRGRPQELRLPSAPDPPLVWLAADDAPQPRPHRDLGGGMAASVGRLRRTPLGDWRFVALSHNAVRGAAGGALLVAELVLAGERA